MIWALIFSVLIAILTGGDSPYLLPKMDSIIKKHVQDDVRKDTLLLLIKETKIERKAFVKADKKLSKELNDLAQSRESTRQDFDNLIQRSHESRKKSNSANLKFINEAQNLITEAEWANMKPDFKKSILKLDKRMQKGAKQTEKAFNKLEKKILNTINDIDKANKVKEALHNCEKSIITTLTEYRTKMLDENSILYQYKVEKQQIIDLQKQHDNNIKKVIEEAADLHFILVENTTENEWNKIKGNLKSPL